MKKFFYINLSIIFISALFYSTFADASTEPVADRLFELKGPVSAPSEEGSGTQNFTLGKTPMELQKIAVNSPLYASYWGDSGTIGFGSAPMPTCFYDWRPGHATIKMRSIDDAGAIDNKELTLQEQAAASVAGQDITGASPGLRITAPLIVNNFMNSDKSRQILFGITDQNYCPLPGSSLFSDYNTAISGEFLISGAVCVVNTILFDAMFKIYCSIIIWFYSIMYSMVIIYVMFYGLALMLGIGQDPIREAPKKIIKIMLIFMLVTNAQVGFRYVHSFFLTVLNSFTSMLAEAQTIHDDSGGAVYQGRISEFYNAFKGSGSVGEPGGNGTDSSLLALFNNRGPLLNVEGGVWSPLNQNDIDIAMGGNSMGAKPPANAGDPVSADRYVPYRMPAQQFHYDSDKIPAPGATDGSKVRVYTIAPVFRPLDPAAFAGTPGLPTWPPVSAPVATAAPASDAGTKKCALDFSYRPDPDIAYLWKLQPVLRCPRNNVKTIPYFLPYGIYCIYDTNIVNANPDKFEVGPGEPIKECKEGEIGANTRPIVLENKIGNLTAECNHVKDFFVGVFAENTIAGKKLRRPCRQSFQGVLGKMDAMISGFVSGDSSQGVTGIIIALALWGGGGAGIGGILLSLFMLTGFLTLFFVSIQLVWTFITAIMALSFLLMISPVFISFLLFKTTEKLFRGWLNALISYTLQPFLAMSFVFFLSAITSFDKINYLIRNELTQKTYFAGSADSKTRMSYRTASFVEPLYEKPSDFDQFYYDNNIKSDPAALLINGEQRQRYLMRKGAAIVSDFFAMHPRYGHGEPYGKNGGFDLSSLDASSSYARINALWNEGSFPIFIQYPGQNPIIKTNKLGIEALVDYLKQARQAAGIGTNPTAPKDPAHVAAWDAAYGTQIIEEIISFYKNGGNFCHVNLASASYERSLGACPEGKVYRGLNPEGDAIITDDGDSFVGEPNSVWGTEYPACKKFCPKFTPNYEPNNWQKPWLANPNINTPRLTSLPGAPACPAHDKYPNGEKCPDADGNGQPDMCYTEECYGWKCDHYCMNITSAQQVVYRDILVSLLGFIIINMVAAGFLSKMPELAAALSNWAPGQKAVRITGGSKIMGAGGGDKWTQSEMSEVYNIGGILSIDPNRPGALLGAANNASMLAGAYNKVNPDGSISRVKGDGIIGFKGIKSLGSKSMEESKAKILGDLKVKLGLDRNESMQRNKQEVDYERLKQVVSSDAVNKIKLFIENRPANSTGLSHSEIWQVIERVLSRSTDPKTISIEIQTAIGELVNSNLKPEPRK